MAVLVGLDPDIERMARFLIAKHGAAAARVAADRARELERAGETSAAELWKEIEAAVRALRP